MASFDIKMRTITNKQKIPLPMAFDTTPWIVFPSGVCRQKQEFFNIFDKTKKSFDRGIPEIHGKQCLASMHGWLVLKNLKPKNGRRKEVQCFMWNTQTRNIIDLPLKNSEDINMFDKCYLSSPPTDPDCMVLFVSETFFLFCQPQDRKWRKEHYELVKEDDCDDYVYHVVTCSNGTIYALTYQGDTAIINRKPRGTLSVSLLNFEKPYIFPETHRFHNYMVESFGDIYYVFIHFLGISESINHVEVFRLSFSNKIWEKVQCIGEVMFIISDYGCMSLSVANSGMEGNKIYFTIAGDNGLFVYGLADESLSIYSPCSKSETHYFDPFWILPNNRLVEIPKENANTTISDNLKMEEMHIIIAAKEENTKDREVSCWTNLTVDVLCSITTHLLFGKDYMNFRHVCKTWKVSVPQIRWTTNAETHCPWLMSSNREICKYSFLDPVSNVVHSVDIPELLGARIWFSKDSWLLMSRGHASVFFYNPFNCATVKLPDLRRRYMFCRMSFSSLPTSPNCIVFGVDSSTPGFVDICYLRIGEKAWTFISRQRNEVPLNLSHCSPVFHNGAFYCLSCERHLGVFRLKDDKCEWTTLASPEPCASMDLNYLVECNGNLLSVTIGSKGKWVKVHKLDCLTMTWTIQNWLEDQVVFVSHSTSMALQGVNKRMQNKIYFPLSFNGEKDYVFFSLDTGRWHSSCNDYTAKDIFGLKQYMHCTWIQPILSWK